MADETTALHADSSVPAHMADNSPAAQSTAPSTNAPADKPYPKPAVAWYIVGVLFLLYWLSILDRLVISLMVGPIRRDLGISDFELSLLQGFAFGVFYALCGLPLGWLIDRFSRRWIIFWGVTIWTISTAACGLAKSYIHLFLARVGVGAGEAALSPASYSILADSFPPHRLTTALSFYSLGSLVGTGAAFILGGLIVGMVSDGGTHTLPVLGALIGPVRDWQLVFIAIGLPGVALAFLVFTFAEPARRTPIPATQPSLRSMVGEITSFIRSQWRFFLFHHAGYTIAIAGVTGLVLWYPAYMMRTFGWNAGEVGPMLGVFYVGGGIFGMILGGIAVDRWFERGRKDAHMIWYAICLVLALPIGVLGILANDPWIFLGSITLVQTLTGSVMSVAAASLQIVTPGNLRGRISAFYLFINILFGIGLGPSVVAFFTDYVFRDDAKVGSSLVLATVICYIAGAICLLLGAKHMRHAVAAAEARG